jgi:hypothetical protein
MSVDWTTRDQKREASVMAAFILNRPLYTDSEKKLVLEAGDSRAAFVIGGKGTPVDAEDVKRYGLDDSHRLADEVGEASAETETDPAPEDADVTATSKKPRKK